MNKSDKHMLGHTLLRVVIGILFLQAGINKFANPDGVVGMLTGIGFPAPVFFAWILLLSEIIFGALILVGYKVKYTAWPLVIIFLVALGTVVIPSGGISSNNALFHIITIAGLITIALTGPGKWALDKSQR